MGTSPNARAGGVTIVVRTLPPERREAYEDWQRQLGRVVAAFPGFLDQVVVPPHPPEQPHWVTLQRFARSDDALAWLSSPERRELLDTARQIFGGPDEVHIVNTDDAAAGAAALITTRVKPGGEAAYRAWQDRIAAALSRAKGFRGYRLEPPIPGVQEAWLVVIRFDSAADMNAWMESPARVALVKEAEPLTDDIQIRTTGGGLEQWFRVSSEAVSHAEWKMSMLVLLVIYPTVFLFDQLVGRPFLAANGVPPWLAMFLGNVACVSLMAFLIPWTGRRFRWWLAPSGRTLRGDLTGFAVVTGLYGCWLAAFAALWVWVLR